VIRVGSDGVVFDPPVFGQYLGFQEGVELFGGQELVAEAAVERFAVGVLPGRAGFDERGLDVTEATSGSQCRRWSGA
jgi:hypothetical protein